MICHFCKHEILAGYECFHHLVAIADGGDRDGEQVPAHRRCHNDYHRERGDYSRWMTANYAERVQMFGVEEVHRLLAHYGRQGWTRLVEKRGPEYLAEFHRRGGRARAANGRDERGRFVASGAGRHNGDHLLEAF